MTADDVSTMSGEDVAGSRTVTDGKGETHDQGGLDLSVAVHVDRGSRTGGLLAAEDARVSESMEGIEESTPATAAASCATGVDQSRSALLQPTEAVRGVLDTIVQAMRSAVAHPDKDRGRKSRPLFDSAPALLKLCEVSQSSITGRQLL